MATLLYPGGDQFQAYPSNGEAFTLEEFYTLLNCTTVQMVGLADGRQMWVDEDGKYKKEL